MIASLLLALALQGTDPGAALYAKKCASCHGAKGEGTKEHPDALVGDRLLDKLADYVQRKMPEDKPGTLTKDEAKAISAWMYAGFYSREAQARNAPPRVELARLTVGQYRNAVADVVGSFGEPGKWDDQRGLRAELFAGRRIRDNARKIDRVDAKIDYDFAAGSPGQGIEAKEYSARWTGGVLAPETGEYEFVIETKNGARLWVNDAATALIDGWVRSGDAPRRESVFLLGGRAYPIRLEYFKGDKEPAGLIRLRWKRPGRAEESIPERLLSPGRFPEVCVIRAPFPPDDRSMGYERATSISRAWEDATTSAAIEAGAYVLSRLDALAGKGPDRLKSFGRRFVERAFRRPLTDDEAKFFVDRPLDGAPDAEASLKRLVLLALKSPRFLYRETGGDANDVACRISFALWDSIPDRELLEAARTGGLDSAAGVAKQVERMLPDLRTRAKLRLFYHHWLGLDRLAEIDKDPKKYPDFTEQVESDLRTSLDLFLDEITWSETSDFRQLLLSEKLPINGRLAKIYGAELPADAPFQMVDLKPSPYAGLLTHPLLMAGHAHDLTSSPIHRGVFVARALLGRRLRPPQDAVQPISPELHPNLTTRERIALQTKSQACMSCHTLINPLGFSLEQYDGLGRFRAEEKGKAIDASGSYQTLSGETVEFKGARALGEFLAASGETQRAFVEHLFHGMIKQPVRAHGADASERLQKAFAANGFSIRKLLADVVQTAALHGREPRKGP
jgi:cytochrome c553